MPDVGSVGGDVGSTPSSEPPSAQPSVSPAAPPSVEAAASSGALSPNIGLAPGRAGFASLPATPLDSSGSGPDGSVPTISFVLVSIIWMVSSSPTATSTNRPSFVSSMPRGLCPTLMVFTAAILSVSITVTLLPFSFDT